MSKSKLLYAPLLVCLSGAVVAAAILLRMLNAPTVAPTAAAKGETADASRADVDLQILASYSIEGQEVERGLWPYIIRRIAVTKSITEQELRVLLLHELEQIRQLDYGPAPEVRCAFTVLAYCESANARNFAGPPLATISLLRDKTQPELSIAPETLAAIKELPELKFGYEDDVRKRIYWELIQANYACSHQVDREFSDMSPPHGQVSRSARFNELWEERQDEIAREYELNREQADGIYSEGLRKHWPQPVYPVRDPC